MVTLARDDNFTKNRPSKVVYWEKIASNAYGEAVVSNPTEISVRFEKSPGIGDTLQANSNTLAYDYELNVDRELTVGGIVWVGALKDLPPPGADVDVYQITNWESIPDLKGRKFDRYVQLIRHNERLKLTHTKQIVGMARENDSVPTVAASIPEQPENPAAPPVVTPPPVGVVPSAGSVGVASESDYATGVGASIPNNIFSWNTGAMSQAEWDAFYITNNVYSVDPPPTVYVGNSSVNLEFNSFDHKFQVPQWYQMPELNAQGNLHFDRKTPSKIVDFFQAPGLEQQHCMIRPAGVSTDFTSDVWYLKPNRRYRCEFTIDFTAGGTMSEAEWDSILSTGANPIGSWCELFDCHPGTFGGNWIGSVEAPIAFYVYDGKFQLWVRGSKGTVPEYEDIQKIEWDYTHGTHSFAIEWEVRHGGSGIGVLPGSNVKVWMDNDLKGDVTQYVGVLGGGSTSGALQMKFGVYGAYASATFERFVALAQGVVS